MSLSQRSSVASCCSSERRSASPPPAVATPSDARRSDATPDTSANTPVCITATKSCLEHLLRTPSTGREILLKQRLENIEQTCGLELDRRRPSRRRCISDTVDINADTADADDAPRNRRRSAAANRHERRLERAPKMPRFETDICTDTSTTPRLEPCQITTTRPGLLVCFMVAAVGSRVTSEFSNTPL